ncbi:hypothetical protein PTKIN_Ptkin12aG0015100 [Pterospermum kingtungense]
MGTTIAGSETQGSVFIPHTLWVEYNHGVHTMPESLLCYPVAGDQSVNCKYIVKVLENWVTIYGFREKDVKESVKKVTEDGEMNERFMRLYQKTMGEEAGSIVVANLRAFLLDSTKSNKQFTSVKDF